MTKISMPEYDIIVGLNEMEKIESHIKEVYAYDEVFIVTDELVYSHYKAKISDWFNAFKYQVVLVPEGEKSKSFDIYLKAIEDLIKAGLKRQHLVIALGGGVIGDLTGFIASTIYRGVPFIQIPTTLLSMVDSSIGGKVGIDLEQGKNLIGSFYQPKKVIIDPQFLNTLSVLEYRNGLAEMIKAGLIGNKELFEFFLSHDQVTEKEIIDAIEVKRQVVLVDPYDYKERMYLNFGHSYGHAIEKKTKYSVYKHGQAISYGMLIALEIGILEGITRPCLYDEVKKVLLRLELVKQPLLEKEDFQDELKYDKKNMANGYHFVFIKDIGVPVIETIKIG